MRSFFSAFFASGSRDLFAVISKEKMLQLDPSSCSACQVLVRLARRLSTLCIHVSCHCAGSIWTGRHRRYPRTSTGRQGPWRLQMRRRTLGNPWRQTTLHEQVGRLATHRRRICGRRACQGDLKKEQVLRGRGVKKLGRKGHSSNLRNQVACLSPDAPPPQSSLRVEDKVAFRTGSNWRDGLPALVQKGHSAGRW